MKKSLIALAFGTLALGMAEFVMMGILPDIARSLGVSIPEAGHLISAYALGDCFALESVYVPQLTTGIYTTAFTNSAKVVLNVAEGSYGEAFAKQHGIAYTTR